MITSSSSSSWMQQEAFTKAAGKKSKSSVELDLGDMLAALEKQQQAMRARQLNNTKPLSLTGTHHLCQLVVPFVYCLNVVVVTLNNAPPAFVVVDINRTTLDINHVQNEMKHSACFQKYCFINERKTPNKTFSFIT